MRIASVKLPMFTQGFVFGISVVGLAGSGMRAGAALVAGSMERLPILLFLCTFLLPLIIRFYG